MNIKPRILGINGIRTDGATSTDKVLSRLANAGFDTVDVNYPQVNIFTARSRARQRRNAQKLVDTSKPGDVLVAHSYGCLLSLRAMELGAQFSHVFFFAPAMNTDFIFPYLGFKSLTVIYNPRDKAIRLGELLKWHDFGAMGRKGYWGAPDPRVENILDCRTGKDSLNHSNFFDELNINRHIQFIINKISQ